MAHTSVGHRNTRRLRQSRRTLFWLAAASIAALLLLGVSAVAVV